MFNAMLNLPKEEIQAAVTELHSITPELMNRMLKRQSKQAAVAKRNARKLLIVVDVPPTMKRKHRVLCLPDVPKKVPVLWMNPERKS